LPALYFAEPDNDSLNITLEVEPTGNALERLAATEQQILAFRKRVQDMQSDLNHALASKHDSDDKVKQYEARITKCLKEVGARETGVCSSPVVYRKRKARAHWIW
jgi:hypothetical protein